MRCVALWARACDHSAGVSTSCRLSRTPPARAQFLDVVSDQNITGSGLTSVRAYREESYAHSVCREL